MKLSIRKGIYSSLLLLAVAGSAAAKPAELAEAQAMPGKIYVSVFGGAGNTGSFGVNQYGTAFYSEAQGGPLAVNAFGDTGSRSGALYGLQFGYRDQEVLISPRYHVTVTPAAEMEGFYFNNETFYGDLTNINARLPEHDFMVAYPLRRSVFLANVVFNFNHPRFIVQPYVGLGIGGAIVRISGASAAQVSPPEPGVNHYNANTSDTDGAFAGQIKAGLVYDITPCISVFAEYRWVYISNTHFVFGSTVAAGHPETSSWQVNLDPQRSNVGTVGIRLNV